MLAYKYELSTSQDHDNGMNISTYRRDNMTNSNEPAGAGAVSASVGCPAELLMIQQQRGGRTLAGEAQLLLSQHGVLKLYKGLVCLHPGLYGTGHVLPSRA